MPDGWSGSWNATWERTGDMTDYYPFSRRYSHKATTPPIRFTPSMNRMFCASAKAKSIKKTNSGTKSPSYALPRSILGAYSFRNEYEAQIEKVWNKCGG